MYQFIHIEAYARKASKVGKKSAWTARDIANEADRKEGAHPHVENPKPPNILFGMSACEVVDFAEEAVEKETITGRTKDGKSFRKAVRSDVPIVLAGVTSFQNPNGLDENGNERSDEQKREEWERYEQWKTLTVEWLKDKYGDGLRSVIEHTDEEHPHLHFYVVAAKPSRTRTLYHDGFKEAGESVKLGEKATAGKAYRSAMTEFQDGFWKAVASRVGMARSGPKRARLTRDQWQKVKAENMMIADTLKRASLKESEADAYLEAAFKEAEAKSKEATDILRKASDTVRLAIKEKIGALITEEERLEKWSLWASKVDEKLKPQIESAQKAYQAEGSLASRVGAKVAQSGGTTVEGLKSNSPNKPR
jgi:hypothetical protein